MSEAAPPPASDDARLAAALWTTSRWPVAHVAAAVVAPSGVLGTVGDADRPFALASVTKLLVAYACLIAVEEGTLDLDEPAGPEGSTVRHLLAHASGLGPDGGVLARPGARRIYANAGFDALAVRLAHNAGMPAVDYVLAAVCEPLAMTTTDVRDRSLASGGWSTAADLARFARELLAPTLVHRSTLDAATTVAFPGLDGVLPGFGRQQPNDWGLGFERRGDKRPHWTGAGNSPATFGHFGQAGTFLWVDPVPQRGLVVLTDRPFDEWAALAWPRLADAVLAACGPSASGQ